MSGQSLGNLGLTGTFTARENHPVLRGNVPGSFFLYAHHLIVFDLLFEFQPFYSPRQFSAAPPGGWLLPVSIAGIVT
jgi:hypothetical protein